MGGAEVIAFIDAMTEAELRDTLVWLSGYSPEGFSAARDHVLRRRELAKARQGMNRGPSGERPRLRPPGA
jgi:hypothetical protein